MLCEVPLEARTTALCLKAVRTFGAALAWVPDVQRTLTVCLLACANAPEAFSFVPQHLQGLVGRVTGSDTGALADDEARESERDRVRC